MYEKQRIKEKDHFRSLSDAELFAIAQQCNIDVEQELYLLNNLAHIIC